MNASRLCSLGLLLAAAAFTPVAMAAQPAAAEASHAHDEAGTAALRLDNGRKWGTDAPLRTGMTHIKELVAAQLPAAHAGRMSAAQYAALAGKVEVEVGQIVANCKLEPQADAMLHLVIAEIGAGTDAMKGKTPGVRPEQGLARVATAYNDYGRFFQHPGHQPIAVGH